MAIALMQKVQVYVHLSKLSELLKALQRSEIIEITDIEDDILGQTDEASLTSRDYLDVLGFLNDLFPVEKGFIENFIPQKSIVNPQEFQTIIRRRLEIEQVLLQMKNLRVAWQDLRRQINSIQTEIAKYEIYHHFPIALKLAGIKKVNFIAGQINHNDYAKLQEALLKSKTNLEFQEQFHDRDEKYLYLSYWYLPEKTTEVVQFLTTRGLKEVVLPEGKVVYRDVLFEHKRNLKELIKTETELIQQIQALYNEHKITLAVMAEYLNNEEKLQSWGNDLVETTKVALINGWVVGKRYPELVNILGKYSKSAHLVKATPSAEEIAPVILKNHLNSPFESVTMIYGLPNSKEFDPTPFLSIFFIVFYGLCLSDFGYGLMLSIMAVFLYHKYKKQLTGFGRKLLVVNSLCGISTMVVGILTGSYFGIDLKTIAYAPARDFLIGLRLNDPVANPLPMLYLALLLGVVQIYTGLWVRYFIDLKQKGAKEAFLVSGIWVYFISGIILWPLASILWKSPILIAVAKFMVYSGMITLVLTQGRHQKNPLMRLGSGLLSLYRVTGFVGDILSYSRLFALGLVTSVLASVINLLAAMTGGIPIFGWLVMGSILVFGHIFDFLINILGAFVHSARLQYVEYFSKFFEGGGRFFKPFVWKTKYVKID